VVLGSSRVEDNRATRRRQSSLSAHRSCVSYQDMPIPFSLVLLCQSSSYFFLVFFGGASLSRDHLFGTVFLLLYTETRDDTAHFQVTTGGLSFPRLMCLRTEGTFTTARRCCDVFRDSGAGYKTAYLFTYFRPDLHFEVFRVRLPTHDLFRKSSTVINRPLARRAKTISNFFWT